MRAITTTSTMAVHCLECRAARLRAQINDVLHVPRGSMSRFNKGHRDFCGNSARHPPSQSYGEAGSAPSR